MVVGIITLAIVIGFPLFVALESVHVVLPAVVWLGVVVWEVARALRGATERRDDDASYIGSREGSHD